jgi:hypothetical protein
MSTSPIDPEDIRAAAEVERELGPEYSDAVVAAFLDKVDRAVAARVEARLAERRGAQPATRRPRRALLKGVAIGMCASAIVAGASIAHVQHGGGQQAPVLMPGRHAGPFWPPAAPPAPRP